MYAPCRLLPFALSLCLLANRAIGQEPPPPPLSFLGFEAGLPLGDLGRRVESLGGKPMHCLRSRREPSVHECRATVWSPGSGQRLALWASVMDSATGVLTLSGPVSGVELDAWRVGLVREFGEVGAEVQGSQWMMQWVRQGRMMRLTWRIERGAKTASVSLVDGRVLDAWGRSHFP